LNLPGWGIGVLVGASLGPVVYIHYYILYIRPLKKRGNIDGK
jgi:tellurite resistance protein TehA-like permease